MGTFKGLDYWKTNAEEDYRQVPISVLRYISELENHIERSKAPEMLDMLEKLVNEIKSDYKSDNHLLEEARQLIKEATEL
jgi:hypothetical protein